MTERERQVKATMKLHKMAKMKEQDLFDEGEKEYDRLINEKIQLANKKRTNKN